jgi:hypothetical protein
MRVIEMVARVVRSDSLVVGWIYHLFNSAVIGALFGWALGGSVTGYGSGLARGLLYGIVLGAAYVGLRRPASVAAPMR